MKRRVSSFLLCLLVLFYISGCANKTEGLQQTAQPPETEAVQWKEKGFALSGPVKEETALWLDRYLPWEHTSVSDLREKEDAWYVGSQNGRALGSKLYMAFSVYNSQTDQAYLTMECYDLSTGECGLRRLSYQDIGIEASGYVNLSGMDVVDEGSYCFWLSEFDGQEQKACKVIYSDLNGQNQITDFWPILTEKNLVKKSNGMKMLQGSFSCDNKGNLYLQTNNSGLGDRDIYVFDREGGVVCEYHGKDLEYVAAPLRTQSGEMIYAIYDRAGQVYQFYWVDTENAQFRPLQSLEGGQVITKLLGMRGELLYYQSPSGIVRWNVRTGERMEVYSLADNAFLKGKFLDMTFDGEGRPLLVIAQSNQKKNWLVTFSEKELMKEEALRVANLTGEDSAQDLLSQCAGLLITQDPNHEIVCERNQKDPGAYKDRIFAELAAGGGPDLLYVSEKDLINLAQKEALLDLAEVIPAETRKEFLPGAIALGTYETHFVGIPMGLSTQGLVVDREVWPGETMRLEDAILLIEAGKIEPLLYYEASGGYFYPLATAMLLTQANLEDSFLIDWENHTCHFEDERYIKLLELLDVDVTSMEQDSELLLAGGRRMAFLSMGSEANAYDFDRKVSRENGHYIGLPTQDGRGSALMASGYLVVNRASKKTQQIRTYLEEFLGEEIQNWPNGIGVKGISPERITYLEDGTPLLGNRELTVFENGETSLHRMQTYLQNCSRGARTYADLNKILYEELNALYLSKDRTPRQTAEILNRRIQLYLWENEQ